MNCTVSALTILITATMVPPHAAGQTTPPAAAQEATLPPAAIPATDAAALAQGWVLLAERKFDEAARAARSIAGRFPRSVASLALMVETDIARAGATTALRSYEGWLGSGSSEEPAALRRIARAFLYEWARQAADAASRSYALVALAEDGDPEARSLIAAGAVGPNARARVGDDKGLEPLLARLAAATGSKVNEIQLLAETGNRRAAPALLPLLQDPLPENRAAAAAALGKLEYREAAGALRQLLAEGRGAVRIAAAGALYQIGDTSGVSVLEELAGSEHATIRRSAALLMASQPTEEWKTLVRGLAGDPDAAIRLDAARLLGPHDPAFSRSILEALASDSNPAIREQAALALAESPQASLTELRRYLHSTAGPVKVRAASRILSATR